MKQPLDLDRWNRTRKLSAGKEQIVLKDQVVNGWRSWPRRRGRDPTIPQGLSAFAGEIDQAGCPPALRPRPGRIACYKAMLPKRRQEVKHAIFRRPTHIPG